MLAQRVGVEQIEGACTRPGRGRLGGLAPRQARLRIDQAGAEVRQAANLAQAAGIRADRDLDQAGALASVDTGEQREVGKRSAARPRRGRRDRCARPRGSRCSPRRPAGAPRRAGRARPTPAAAASSSSDSLRQKAHAGPPGPGAAAAFRPRPRRVGRLPLCLRASPLPSARRNASLHPGRVEQSSSVAPPSSAVGWAAATISLASEAAHRLAHAQVDDRRLVHRVGADHEHDRRAVDVRDAGGQLGPREQARGRRLERAAAARVDVARSRGPRGRSSEAGSPPRWWSRRRPARRRRRRPSRSPSTAVSSARSQLTGPQVAAVADQRLGDPVLGVDRLVAEAPLVAQPAVVDVRGSRARARARRVRRGP